MITAVDSNTALSVNDNIFVSGDAYSVGTANPKVDGAVFTEVPAFHYVWTEDGTNTYIIISSHHLFFENHLLAHWLKVWFTLGLTKAVFILQINTSRRLNQSGMTHPPLHI